MPYNGLARLSIMEKTDKGEFLRSLRLKKGLKQKDLASFLGFSVQSVSAWEKGISFPDIRFWKKMCDLYDVSLSSFLLLDLSKAGRRIDSEFDADAFVSHLASLRKAKGITQAELAAELGLNPKTVGSFESGKSLPSRQTFLDLCRLYGLSPEELYFVVEEGEEEEAPSLAVEEKGGNAKKGWARYLLPGLLLFTIVAILASWIPFAVMKSQGRPSENEPSASASASFVSASYPLPIEAKSMQSEPSADQFRLILLNQSLDGEYSFRNTLYASYGDYPYAPEWPFPMEAEDKGVIKLFQDWDNMEERVYEDKVLRPLFKEMGLSAYRASNYRFQFLPNGEELELLEYYGEIDEDFSLPSYIGGYPVASLNLSFANNEKIKTLHIPDTVKYIRMPIVIESSSLEKIEMSKNLEEVDSLLTLNTPNLSYGSPRKGIRYIGNQENPYIYCECDFEAGRDYPLEEGVRALSSPFLGKTIGHINIPDSLVSINSLASQSLGRCASFSLGSGALHYEKRGGCLIKKDDMSLIMVMPGTTTIPEGIRVIHPHSLSNYSSARLSFPSSVTDIKENALKGNDAITSIQIGENAAFIAPNAFTECPHISFVDVAAGNPYYSSNGGMLFSRDGTKLFFYPSGSKSDEFSYVGSGLGRYCFDRSLALTSLSLIASDSDSLFVLGEKAVASCPALIEISLDIDSFCYCSVSACPKLEAIRFGKRVKMISSEAIRDCPALKKIYYEGSEKEWGMVYRQDKAFPSQDIEIICLE